ncbi:hypothetical protein [Roseibacillus ishigakijimensis]|uniref:Uncharacterized protein n=1 Tax=Roseibacillus ishigakijimensis TaxID=454146 RepID=A0A934RTX0_9BACT|nr:hypothetical protein [Roseibacillus ishigakijimensis]MBK1835586.1 hypothetical protein [Roseibacillus ishigakijimensis]
MAGIDASFFEKLWAASFSRFRRPVEGVLLPVDLTEELVRELWERLLSRYPEMPGKAVFSAALLEEAHDYSRHRVREERTREGDPQRYHDPADGRYEANLDLDKLQRRGEGREAVFPDREWDRLPPVLRAFAFSTLARRGVRNQDAEDVFMETFAELPRPKGSDQRAPIETIQLFEEVIPLFTKMIQFRAIDWIRKRAARKNQPNSQFSYEELTEEQENVRQFEDRSARAFGEAADLTFDRIYDLCQEALTPFEWELVFAVHVSQSHTMGELLEEGPVLEKLQLRPSDSISKKRRILNEKLHGALSKLADILQK